MKGFLHFLFWKLCRRHLIWDGNVLRCSVCGDVIGGRYLKDNATHVFLFTKYHDWKQDILDMPDTAMAPYVDLEYQEFDQFMEELKYSVRSARDMTLEENEFDE